MGAIALGKRVTETANYVHVDYDRAVELCRMVVLGEPKPDDLNEREEAMWKRLQRDYLKAVNKRQIVEVPPP